MTFTHEIGKVVCDLDLIVAKFQQEWPVPADGLQGPGDFSNPSEVEQRPGRIRRTFTCSSGCRSLGRIYWQGWPLARSSLSSPTQLRLGDAWPTRISTWPSASDSRAFSARRAPRLVGRACLDLGRVLRGIHVLNPFTNSPLSLKIATLNRPASDALPDYPHVTGIAWSGAARCSLAQALAASGSTLRPCRQDLWDGCDLAKTSQHVLPWSCRVVTGS